jgi:ubiquinone/menaquinone biosynthesis C-methylase UbiE
MAVLESLTPAERARQLGNPDGAVGLAVAEWLNENNRQDYSGIIALLNLEPDGHVLEIGFGNGRMVGDVITQAAGIRYAGIDISLTMVEEARRFNAAQVAAGRVRFHLGSAEKMPFDDASFDRVFSIGVAHFWADPVGSLAEVRRVLRPGGVSLMGCLQPREAPEFAKPEHGFFLRDTAAWQTAYHNAGFAKLDIESIESDRINAAGATIRRYSFRLTARA